MQTLELTNDRAADPDRFVLRIADQRGQLPDHRGALGVGERDLPEHRVRRAGHR